MQAETKETELPTYKKVLRTNITLIRTLTLARRLELDNGWIYPCIALDQILFVFGKL